MVHNGHKKLPSIGHEYNFVCGLIFEICWWINICWGENLTPFSGSDHVTYSTTFKNWHLCIQSCQLLFLKMLILMCRMHCYHVYLYPAFLLSVIRILCASTGDFTDNFSKITCRRNFGNEFAFTHILLCSLTFVTDIWRWNFATELNLYEHIFLRQTYFCPWKRGLIQLSTVRELRRFEHV